MKEQLEEAHMVLDLLDNLLGYMHLRWEARRYDELQDVGFEINVNSSAGLSDLKYLEGEIAAGGVSKPTLEVFVTLWEERTPNAQEDMRAVLPRGSRQEDPYLFMAHERSWRAQQNRAAEILEMAQMLTPSEE